VITVAGNTVTWDGAVSIEGKQFRIRAPIVMSDDRASGIAKGEFSSDGKPGSHISDLCCHNFPGGL
jgi:hypothetical protein